jgi:hypothetical protein
MTTRFLKHSGAIDEIAGGSRQLTNSWHEGINELIFFHEFEKVDGGTHKIPYFEAALLLQELLTSCEPLGKRFVIALIKYPSSYEKPWNLIVGFDEFNPGDKLKSWQVGKKSMGVYFSFQELESTHGIGWFILASIRETLMDQTKGNWSRILASILRHMLLGTHGLSRTGVAFTYRNEHYVFFAKLSNLLSDGDGHRKAIAWRGPSSFRPAILHSNILKKGSDLAQRRPGFVEISCCDPTKIHKTTSSEFYERCDLVEAAHRRHAMGNLRNGLFEDIVQSASQNFVEGGIAFDRILRDLDWFSCITIDWVHTLLQDGVFTVEAKLMCMSTESTGSTIKQYLQQDWEFPHFIRTKGKALWRVFDSYRVADDDSIDKVRSSASELLGLFCLLRHYFDRTVGKDHPALGANWASFDACCELMAFILACKNRQYKLKDAAPKLKDKIADYMQKHVFCYGDRYCKPKHAWLWALIEHWLRDPDVYDCFIVERTHLILKETCVRVDNTSVFEKTILAGSFLQMKEIYQNAAGHCYLVGKTETRYDLPDTIFARVMVNWGTTFTVGDMVMYQDEACELLACAFDDGYYYGIVEVFSLQRSLSRFGAKWRRSGRVKVASTRDMVLAIMGYGVA